MVVQANGIDLWGNGMVVFPDTSAESQNPWAAEGKDMVVRSNRIDFFLNTSAVRQFSWVTEGMDVFRFSGARQWLSGAENLSTGGAETLHEGGGRRPPVTGWHRVGMFSIIYALNYHKSLVVNDLYACQ